MHHRLASNPVRCDLGLYEDRSHYSVAFFYSLICFCHPLSLSLISLSRLSLSLLSLFSLSLSPKKIVCIGLCFIIALFV